jgi:DNA replication protein DnaC
MATTHEQLLTNLEYLKLKEMKNHLDDTVNFINKNNLSFVDGLIKLTSYEIDYKEASMIKSMVKVGAFPHFKELNDFDFTFQENINKEQILDFTNHRFIHQCENIIFMGSSGVGKTHLSTSIGISAAKKRISTYFIKCHDLIAQLKKAKLENRLEDRLKHFTKYRLLVIDELGYLPIEKEDSKLFFQLIDRRYEKRSTIITTNINFSNWDEVFRDPVIANAILDRVLHHAHVINITGKSYRLKNYFIDED